MKLEAKNLLDALSEKGINYKLFEHEAFFTVEESSKLKNDLDMQGAHTKNLFPVSYTHLTLPTKA